MIEPGTVRVAVIDDEKNIRRSIQIALETGGYRVSVFQEAIKGFEALQAEDFDLAIVDIRLEGVDGLQLFRKIRAEGLSIPVIFISGNASLSEAVEAVRLGAFDFLEKPFSSEKLLLCIERCLEHQLLKAKIKALELSGRSGLEHEMVGESRAIRKIIEDASKVAGSDATVLIQGESGTGKELVAKMIHDRSKRADRPFIKVNCSAIPENLIESELFGYERGAFTGAVQAKRGQFELANRGTLFLDEIGDMALSAQAKVLRAIQSREIQKLGSEKSVPVDVRIIAATHKNLRAEALKGAFREDLFYRIAVVPIETVPLREHTEDIPVLAGWFVKQICRKNGFREKRVASEVLDALRDYAWPGNVRELLNLVERMVIMSGDEITLTDLPGYLKVTRPEEVLAGNLPLEAFRQQAEREYLVSTLRKAKGNISKAAELLVLERTYLHRKISQLGIRKSEYFLD
jgi:DNA-binding NtrC family response regulator